MEGEYYNVIQPSNILDLPEDFFINHLAKYLSLKDLFTLRCCSQNCKDLVERMFTVRREVIICGWKISLGAADPPNVIKFLANACRRLHRLYLLDIWWMKDDTLLPLLNNNPCLEVVDFLGCADITEKGLHPLSVQCKNLKSLMIEGSSCSDQFLDTITLHNNHLVEVNLSCQLDLSPESVNAFFEKQPHLKTILLLGMKRGKPRGINFKTILGTIGDVCKDLENLDIRRNLMNDVGDQDVLNIARKCLKIRYLLIDNITLNLLNGSTVEFLESRNIITKYKSISGYESHPFYLSEVLKRC
uniref:Uncharacterized protein n=1 Tax=Nyssomyia neivai TaxID=330878 RepID=A0A1L8DB82_9DIPT